MSEAEDNQSDSFDSLQYEYDAYLKDYEVYASQATQSFENLDKWLLAISTGGFAAVVSKLLLGDGAANLSLQISSIAFAIAICIALTAKGLSVILVNYMLKEIRAAWKVKPRKYRDVLKSSTDRKLKAIVREIWILNILCFMLFLTGVISLSFIAFEDTVSSDAIVQCNCCEQAGVNHGE